MIRIDFPGTDLDRAKLTASSLLYEEGVQAVVYETSEGYVVLDLDGFHHEKVSLELVYNPERRATSRHYFLAPKFERIDAKSA